MANRFHIVEAVCHSMVRMYERDKHSEDPFLNQEEFEVVLSMHYEKPDEVFIFGWLSRVELTKADIKDIYAFLRSKGIKKARYYRHGKLVTKEL